MRGSAGPPQEPTSPSPGAVLTPVMPRASTPAVGVTGDVAQHSLDRFRALDINGAAFIAGHVAASTARNALSAALVFAVAIPMGLRSSATPLAWLAAAGLITLLILAVSWLTALGGLLVSSPDAASSFTFFLMLIPFTSSAFVPIATMPGWLQAFANNQPVTYTINTMRGLALGHQYAIGLAANFWKSAAWIVGIFLVFGPLAVRAYKRAS